VLQAFVKPRGEVQGPSRRAAGVIGSCGIPIAVSLPPVENAARRALAR
jgi:hypothetical protein